jgi:antitoxin CptB
MNLKKENNFTPELAKLRWACRRGMLELDVLLSNFLEKTYPALSLADQKIFSQLLTQTDPELFAWLMGQSIPEDKNLAHIVEMIRRHARSRI